MSVVVTTGSGSFITYKLRVAFSIEWANKNIITHTLRLDDVSLSEQKNTITHKLRVEDVSIEWTVKKTQLHTH